MRQGTDRPLAIVAALERELRPARKKIGREAIYLTMGMGKENIMTTLPRFIEDNRPRMLILTGFAGGLQPELGTGALVLADGFLRPDSNSIMNNPELSVEKRLIALAENILRAHTDTSVQVYRGKLLTVEQPIRSVSEKNRLGSDFSALAVDMESWWVATQAQVLGVPVVCLKAVLDPVNKALPCFVNKVRPDGGLAPRFWTELVRRPGELADLLWLARAERQASQALATAVPRLVEHLGSHSERESEVSR